MHVTNLFTKASNIPTMDPRSLTFSMWTMSCFSGSWNSSNFINLSRILRCFHASSGLRVNFHKSKVYGIGVLKGKVASCARILGCEAARFRFSNLGVSVGANMTKKNNWARIIDRVKTASPRGRLRLYHLEVD